MSADRWSRCPKCEKSAWDELDKLGAAVEAAEKANDLAAYKKAQAALDKVVRPSKLEQTMREDWDLGFDDDGKFSVVYDAHCNKCGFKFEHKFPAQ